MPAVTFDGLGHFRVHQLDGETEDVHLTGKAVVEAERRWPGVKADGSDRYRPNEGVHYMVWISLGQPLGDFEKWLDTGLSLEVIDGEQEAVPPTSPIAGVA